MELKEEPEFSVRAPTITENDLELFSAVASIDSDNVTLVVSRQGWHCKRCNVIREFSSGESMNDHLLYLHKIDTQDKTRGHSVKHCVDDVEFNTDVQTIRPCDIRELWKNTVSQATENQSGRSASQPASNTGDFNNTQMTMLQGIFLTSDVQIIRPEDLSKVQLKQYPPVEMQKRKLAYTKRKSEEQRKVFKLPLNHEYAAVSIKDKAHSTSSSSRRRRKQTVKVVNVNCSKKLKLEEPAACAVKIIKNTQSVHAKAKKISADIKSVIRQAKGPLVRLNTTMGSENKHIPIRPLKSIVLVNSNLLQSGQIKSRVPVKAKIAQRKFANKPVIRRKSSESHEVTDYKVSELINRYVSQLDSESISATSFAQTETNALNFSSENSIEAKQEFGTVNSIIVSELQSADQGIQIEYMEKEGILHAEKEDILSQGILVSTSESVLESDSGNQEVYSDHSNTRTEEHVVQKLSNSFSRLHNETDDFRLLKDNLTPTPDCFLKAGTTASAHEYTDIAVSQNYSGQTTSEILTLTDSSSMLEANTNCFQPVPMKSAVDKNKTSQIQLLSLSSDNGNSSLFIVKEEQPPNIFTRSSLIEAAVVSQAGFAHSTQPDQAAITSLNSNDASMTATAQTTISSPAEEESSSSDTASKPKSDCSGLSSKQSSQFVCSFCEHSFEDLLSLQAHVKHYKDQEPVKCKVCHNNFHSIDLLNIHIYYDHETALSSVPYCFTCKKSIYRKGLLVNHIALKHSTSKGLKASELKNDSKSLIYCTLCNQKIVNNPKKMANHFKTHKGGDFRCEICGKIFRLMYLLHAHMYVEHNQDKDGMEFEFDIPPEVRHQMIMLIDAEQDRKTPPKAINCSICGKFISHRVYNMLQHLMNHYRLHRSDLGSDSVYHCPDCGKDVPNAQENINYHRLTHGHVDSRNSKLRCDLCGDIFITEKLCQRHRITEHKLDSGKGESDWDKKYICEICGQAFIGKIQLSRHVEQHGEERGLFNCKVCNKGFELKSAMEVHQARHGNLDETRSCSHCGKPYICRASLERHIQVEHFGVKNYRYKCHQCPAQYMDSLQLRDHIATKHEGKRPYACTMCPLTFVCRPTLKRHMRREHEEAPNPYVCKICGEKFIEKHYLARHEVIHTGVDPLTCTYCKKSFRREKFYKDHMSCHKGIRPYLCEDCGMSYASVKHLKRHKARACATSKHGSSRYKVQLIESLAEDCSENC